MSYAGPPNEEEMMRHRNRHQTGNRNFPEPVAVQQPKQRPMTAKGKGGKKGGPRQRVQTAKPQQDYDKIWKQQQIEAQQNRQRNQQMMEDEGGLTRFAKGGMAITIASAPADERSRSGSQPRYPYTQEPFTRHRQQDRPASNGREEYYQHERSNSQGRQGQRQMPVGLAGIESTIKSKVDMDRRLHQEKQRIQESRQYQQ